MTERPGTVVAIERAADVLSLFASAESSTLGVSDIARQLDLSKAVVHRILASLMSRDYVRVDLDTRRYSLGAASLSLGLRYLDDLHLHQEAMPALRTLSDETGETATFSVAVGDDKRVYVDQVMPARTVRVMVEIGQTFPLYAGASSKALLAFMAPDRQASYLDRSGERLLQDLPTDLDDLRAELAEIRARGYAETEGERLAGTAAVAAPILDRAGRPIASISVAGPIERFTTDR
ncbi:MAG: IclR family transcriptional regulator, partial [Actinobacteria bacterium]|nr:IclR family transcriptional regulator [Actinomycetota bacterium]NIU69895.1 IclR family transcriptional regulator [Actinomycetota bacterium]NIW31773.1 helix-turn-helix domain-containing protein [Actinomycetota bacterium]